MRTVVVTGRWITLSFSGAVFPDAPSTLAVGVDGAGVFGDIGAGAGTGAWNSTSGPVSGSPKRTAIVETISTRSMRKPSMNVPLLDPRSSSTHTVSVRRRTAWLRETSS